MPLDYYTKLSLLCWSVQYCNPASGNKAQWASVVTAAVTVTLQSPLCNNVVFQHAG